VLRHALLVCVALLLSGCVLESAEPLIPDAEADLVLGADTSRYSLYALEDGVWKIDEGPMTFTAEGNHYRVADGKSEMVFTFKTISGALSALQAQDEGKPATYLIAEKQDNDIFILPLDCKKLREAMAFTAMVEFKDDDCNVKPGIDTGQLFAEAIKLPFPKELKLVRETSN
jgi:hypothetical protein